MLLGAVFWTGTENFDRVRDCLTKKYGLVLPTGSANQYFLETHLVHEDERLVHGSQKGVYRVNFKIEHPQGMHIGFRYYQSRLNPAIEKEDPMKQVMLEVYDMLKPVKVTNWAIQPIDLEQLLRP